MTVDPTDDCTFWYTNEDIQANGTFNWNTWIQSFSFSSCGGGGGGPTTGTLSGTVTNSVTHAAISGATVTLSSGPSTTTDALGNYSFTLTGGSYSVTASASGYTTSAPANVLVTNGATTDQDFALVATGGGATVPASPAKPTASAGPGKGVTVKWTAPANGGSPITGYTLKRYTATSSTCNTTLSATFSPGNVTSYKDGSTTKGSYYCYSVTAINNVGASGESPKSSPIRPTR